MSANDLLSWIGKLLFFALSVMTAVDYLRRPSALRREIALVFAAVAVPILSADILTAFGVDPLLRNAVSLTSYIAQPYFLLRVARHFRPVPLRAMRLALAGFMMGCVLIVVIGRLDAFGTIVSTVAIIGNFVVVNLYAWRVFLQGARMKAGVLRQRMKFAAWGAALLAFTYIAVLITLLSPGLGAAPTVLVYLMLAMAAACFYAGFAPPAALRRFWQLQELRQFLIAMNNRPMYERLSLGKSLEELCESADAVIGGVGAAVIRRASDDVLSLACLHGLPDLSLTTLNGTAEDGLEQCLQRRQPVTILAATAGPADRALIAAAEADLMHACPITMIDGVWGLLVVFQRSPLFPEDDLSVLALYAQQSGVFLENSLLVEELRSRSEELESWVDDRTRALRQSQEQYRRIVETAQEGIWVTGRTHETLFVNRRMADMLGTTVEDMLASPVSDFIDPNDMPLVESLRERRGQGAVESYEFSFKRRDGSALSALVSAAPMHDEFGMPIGSLAMIADITEIKGAEAAMRQLNAELEQRVQMRTAALSTVNRELEAFAYSVSHDLRAPLRAIDGFSQALLEDYSDTLDREGLALLNRVRAAAQRMALLIDDLLNLSRISRSEITWQQVDLSALAESVMSDIRNGQSARDVDVVIEPGLVAHGDPRLLRVVLDNLLGNAWKFTRDAEKPRIEVKQMRRSGREAFMVRDNGAGFNMAYVDKLFGAFQRLHSVNEFEGTGVGLATVQRIIHRHGGQIWAEGEVGRGATFYFTLQSAFTEKDEGRYEHDIAG